MTREEAIERLKWVDPYNLEEQDLEAIDMAIKALSTDVVQGKWIKTVNGDGWHDWYVFKCPLCGATIEDRQYRSWEYNFCPNCGADMKGGDDE